VSIDPDSREVFHRGPVPLPPVDEHPLFNRPLVPGFGLSAGEQEIAHRIADADAGVRRQLRDAVEEHSHPELAYDLNYVDREPCGPHRCAEVVYDFPGGRYLVAYVDLVSERVVKITRRVEERPPS
jgi:hypothetical protein